LWIPEEWEAMVHQMTHPGASSLKGSVSSNVEMWPAGFNCMFKNMLTAIVFENIIANLHNPHRPRFPTEALHFVEH
jgi:hypothetical protein